MTENIEKLLAHYQFQLIKEQGKQEKDITKIEMLNMFINDLKQIIQSEKTSSKKKTNAHNVQHEIVSCIEPELVVKKKRKDKSL